MNLIKYRIISIGVSNYDDDSISDLLPCDSEASLIFNSFTDSEIGLCIKNESISMRSDKLKEAKESNRSNIISSLDRVCELSNQDEGVMVYFSGHGHEVNGENYLIVKDTASSSISKTAISIKYIYEVLRGSKAKSKILILDCCKPGFLLGKELSNNENIEKEITELQKSYRDENFIVLASCKAKQLSHLLKDESSSVFTHYLYKGITGEVNTANEKIITINELYEYLKENVRKWSLQNNVQQVPFFSYEGTSIHDLVIARKVVNKAKPESKDRNLALDFKSFKVVGVEFSGSDWFLYPVKYEEIPFDAMLASSRVYTTSLGGHSNKIEVVEKEAIPEYKEKAEKRQEQKLAELSAKLIKLFDVKSFKRPSKYSHKITFENGYTLTKAVHFHDRSECEYSIYIERGEEFELVISEFEKQFRWDTINIECESDDDNFFIALTENIKANKWNIIEFVPDDYILFEFEPLGHESYPAKIKIKNGFNIIFYLRTISKEHDLRALLTSLNTILPTLK